MKMALALARKGEGWVNPNPMVGAVIVKDDCAIGQGYHEKFGGLHAERNALANCTASPQNATLYVTLEPCCHYGKTPPCIDAILNSGISRVVIGTLDPNPNVAGKGIDILQKHGIQVDVGILENECKELIKSFAKFITTGKPYVMMKYAMTMDGKIATSTNESKWITGETARLHVHRTRHQYTAIMIGVNTVIQDNPSLTCRLEHGKNPIRIICDTHLRTPLSSSIVETANQVDTFIVTSQANEALHRAYQDKGCKMLVIGETNHHLNLTELMTVLGSMGIDSILLEGGSTLNWSALEAQIVDCIQAYIAPKLLGGATAKSPIGGLGISSLHEAFHLKQVSVQQISDDYLIESDVIYPCLQES